MGKNVQIDFTVAKNVSDDIYKLVNTSSNIFNKYGNMNTSISNLPTGYFKKTISEISNLINKASKLNSDISTFKDNFDKSVDNYYRFENDIPLDDDNIVTDSFSFNTNSSDKFVWGYKRNSTGIGMVNQDEIKAYLLNKGAIQNAKYANLYQITIDGVEYKYDIKGRLLYVNNKQIKCDFYLSNNYNNEQIDNVVTVLGGTGERGSGLVYKDKKLDLNISFSNKALMILPYSGNTDTCISSDSVAGASRFGEYVFNASTNSTRSIVGYSEGSFVGAKTVSENPELYDNIVFINGCSIAKDGAVNAVKNGNYDGFKKANIMYFETGDGWTDSKTNQQKGVIYSIDDLIDSGVDPNNITLITNDSKLRGNVNNKINFNDTMPEVQKTGRRYYGHGPGAWDIFNDSEVLNYLSMK